MINKTRIVATIGIAEKNGSRENLKEMMKAGMDVARINFAHADYNMVKQQIRWLRRLSVDLHQKISIYADLSGPKIRLGKLAKSIEVKKNDELGLMYNTKHSSGILPTTFDLSKYVKPKQRIFLFDGKIETEVVSVIGKIVKVVCKNDGVLTSGKGINLPDTSFIGSALTEKDLADLEFINKNDFDWVGLSFVHSADDVMELRKIAENKPKIVAKIETKAAIESKTMKEIIKASDIVMVARGDMAYEIGPELVPIIQRKIIDAAKKAKRKSIVATQMMASMVDSNRPTRAEVSDVARAVYEGASYTMLSEETATGEYSIDAVREMAKIIKSVTKSLASGEN